MTTKLRIEEQQLYINGKHVSATSKKTFENLNPATGKIICSVQEASLEDVNDAVTSAQKGFKIWSAMTGAERGRILQKAAQLLRERNDELAALEVMDSGKPISEAIAVDISSGADAIEYFAGLAASLSGEHYDLGSSFAYTRREPLGVCAGIGAWNYPIQIACWKSAPALACGNAMIFKPSELTPVTALKLAEIYSEAGLPDGVFNVVQGGANVGEALTLHPGIAKVSLTGSVSTGKKLMSDASKTLKHVTLELGGKSPLIIFADADIDNAVSAALMANFYTQGEICSNGTRVFVEKSLHKAFLEKLLPRVANIRVGDPTDPSTQFGALISQEHQVKVLHYIKLAQEEGAKLLCGGEIPKDPALKEGNYILPTVFDKCTDTMRSVKDEIFGPVMSVLTFEDEEEVISRANNTPFGLAAGVFTKDLMRGHRVIAKLEAGTCWINNYNITPIEMPFGGYKQSGIGRENSRAAIEHYTQIKSVYVEMGDVESPF
ncbi:MAG: betaine-aldehyde dehydrogenase [Chlamydiales bacterium]|jgi:betaine-aldehyde dehydrogenase